MRAIKITNRITERTDNTTRFFNDISEIEIISAEKEIELADRIKNGDQKAKDELIRAHLRFAISVAKQYQTKKIPLDDLIQASVEGMTIAAGRFDASRGFKFISFAVHWMRSRIHEELNRERVIRIPLNKVEENRKELRKEEIRLQKEHIKYEFTAPDFEVLPIGKIYADKNTGEGENSTIGDYFFVDTKIPDEPIMNESVKETLLRFIDSLTERESIVIKETFGFNGDPKNLEDIGKIIGVTRERTRQIRNTAIRKLRAKQEKILNHIS